MNNNPHADKQISPSLVFYLLHAMQVGIGILNFQAGISKMVGNDAWLTVLIAGLLFHFIIFIIYKILKGSNGNLITVHKKLYGKFLGNLLSSVILFYFLGMAIIVTRSYIEIVQVWIFPQWKTWSLCLVLIVLIYYINSGGFRTVLGMAFFGIVIPFYLILTAFYPLEFSDFHNLLPLWDHSPIQMFKGVMKVSTLYLGVITLMIYYHYIKEPERSQKWAHFGLLLSIGIYLTVSVITIAYYGSEQVGQFIWPTLGLWKIVELPFAERFEYIGIASWLLVILPTVCLPIWCIGHSLKQMFKIRHRKTLIVLLIIILISNILLTTHQQIEMYLDLLTKLGIYIVFGYVPLLWILQTIKHRWIANHE